MRVIAPVTFASLNYTGLVCLLYGGDVRQAKKRLQCCTPSPCLIYRLQSPARSYLKAGTWGYRSLGTGSRAAGDPPWTLGQFWSSFSICLTQQRTKRSSGRSAKLHWEKAKKLLPAPSVTQKPINQRFFRSLFNFSVLFHLSALWTGTRVNMTKTVQTADRVPALSGQTGATCANVPTLYRLAISIVPSSCFIPSTKKPSDEGTFFLLLPRATSAAAAGASHQ